MAIELNKGSKRIKVFIVLLVVNILFGVVPIVFTHITYQDIVTYIGILNGLGAVYIGGESIRPSKKANDNTKRENL